MMVMQTVQFEYITGLKRSIFRNARLQGSWDASGRFSDTWSEVAMQEGTGDDGCPVFTASVSFDSGERAKTFKWGVLLDGPQGANIWGVPMEVQDVNSAERYRQFQLQATGPQVEQYFFTYARRLGANRRLAADGTTPNLHFGVWAPNAQSVDVVFGDSSGYISNEGKGIDPAQPVVSLSQRNEIWEGGPAGVFDDFMSLPYMYRVKNAQGKTVYRTDIYSRSQMGKGDIDPAASHWDGTPDTLNGTVSCSVVIDPDVVRRQFESTPPGTPPDLISAEEFWATEFTPGKPVATRLEDVVIYELHIGSLGFGKAGPGDLGDAMTFLDHLTTLGVNAVELMPMAQFSGTVGWGYGDSHHFCIESSAGGRDKYRHFVRECHRRGIAVLQDVVYNHYDPNAERAEWDYDSTADQDNIYYWYQGKPSDYARPDGGYLDNGSTGFTPRFWEETVRQQFISSAAFLIEEMHVDGLRVDLTQAIHRDNVLHANGQSVGSANIFGQKLLREWSRTLNMIRPTVMLVAEDHTGWDAVTKPTDQGGLGFNARWQAAFYHNLIGDADGANGQARLLKQAGFGGNEPLSMDMFAGNLHDTPNNQVVFHESHDEAGNDAGTERTIVTAVNEAALFGATRLAAEARCRVCVALSLLSAATPMFFMGEEIGAQQPYTYDKFLSHREDILGQRTGNGAALFRFYQDLLTFNKRFRSVRSHNIDILHQSNSNRVIAFKRWLATEQVIVIASLNNAAFSNGYQIQKDSLAIADGGWRESFNSDSRFYGGNDVGNGGGTVWASGGALTAVLPASGFVVLVKQ
jgi:1,4-alpha-glucan branching enzyme